LCAFRELRTEERTGLLNRLVMASMEHRNGPIGKRHLQAFRFYGPEKPLFDKSWKLPDIEKIG
jgi:hypothetical protein